jgi:hypothetical protein
MRHPPARKEIQLPWRADGDQFPEFAKFGRTNARWRGRGLSHELTFLTGASQVYHEKG